MKNRNPNAPTTIRGMRERYSRRGVLDTRKQSEADVLTAEVAGPFGKAFDRMRLPGSTQEFIVTNQSRGTLAPGTSGLLMNTSGKESGLTRIGGPPPGKKGGGGATRNRRRRGTAFVDANQYAFGDDGATMSALLYADGTFASLRATRTLEDGTHAGCILTDSSALVGDGSLILRDENTHRVWDVEGEAVHSYTTPGGWILRTSAYYQNGKLYWIESQEIVSEVTNSYQIRLRSADTDLDNAATIETVTRDVAGAQSDLGGSTITYFVTDSDSAALAVDLDGAVVYYSVRPQDENGERIDVWRTQFRFVLTGGAPASREWTSPPELSEFMGATISTTSFALCQEGPDGYPVVLSKTDDATDAAASFWPADAMESYVNIASLACFGVGPNGITLQAYSATYGILRGTSMPTTEVTVIDLFDTISPPTSMFYFGE